MKNDGSIVVSGRNKRDGDGKLGCRSNISASYIQRLGFEGHDLETLLQSQYFPGLVNAHGQQANAAHREARAPHHGPAVIRREEGRYRVAANGGQLGRDRGCRRSAGPAGARHVQVDPKDKETTANAYRALKVPR